MTGLSEFEEKLIIKHGLARDRTHFLNVCKLCDESSWRYSSAPRDGECIIELVYVQGGLYGDCRVCTGVYNRAPEIAEWVEGIVIKLRYEMVLLKRQQQTDISDAQVKALIDRLAHSEEKRRELGRSKP